MIYRLPVSMFVIVLASALFYYGEEIKEYGKGLMPIRYVRVGGAFEFLGEKEVKNLLLPKVSTDFFSADMNAIQNAVLSLPWVSKAEVKRIWPDAIDIQIYEQKPVVRWGEESLLNEEGDVFTPKNIAEFGALPLLRGPAGYEKRLLTKMRELKVVLTEKSLDLNELNLNERRSWKMILKNGVQFHLGRTDPIKIIERFLKTKVLLGEERMAAISMIDMRYPNGFAVTWKPDASIDWEQDSKKESAI